MIARRLKSDARMQAPQGKLKEFDAGDAKKEFLCIPLLIAKWCKWRSDALMQVMHVMHVMQVMQVMQRCTGSVHFRRSCSSQLMAPAVPDPASTTVWSCTQTDRQTQTHRWTHSQGQARKKTHKHRIRKSHIHICKTLVIDHGITKGLWLWTNVLFLQN